MPISLQERPGNSGRRERKLGGRDGRTKRVEGSETVCGNCLANTRNLINAHLFPGRKLEVQEEQAEGTEEGEGSGDERVSGQAQRHSGCIQQMLHKCLAPSPAEQKAGSRGWRPQQEEARRQCRGV